MAKMSPQNRTNRWIDPVTVHDDAERSITRTLKKDLFGFIDIVALVPGQVLGIQATSLNNYAARLTKVIFADTLEAWLLTGSAAIVLAWGKNSKGIWYGKAAVVGMPWAPRSRKVVFQEGTVYYDGEPDQLLALTRRWDRVSTLAEIRRRRDPGRAS